MTNNLISIEKASQLILTGAPLLIAGDESALSQLPSGKWIGGTIPYFIASRGGCFSQDEVFVTSFPESVRRASIKIYDAQTLPQIYIDAPSNGFSVALIPHGSPVHFDFGMSAPEYEGFATRPLIGWVAGTSLDASETRSPKVFAGDGSKPLENSVLVMHMPLRPGTIAEIGIINPFEPGDGDVIAFLKDGTSVRLIKVNGITRPFKEYLEEIGADTRFPIVHDAFGVIINTSFKEINEETGDVTFYAPVFQDLEYKLARPLDDYIGAFLQQTPPDLSDIVLSFNCILNYLYSSLEGKKTGNFQGPTTFGEIAYQLLTQTLVYMKITRPSQQTTLL